MMELNIKEIIHHEVIGIPPTAPVSEAIAMMREHRISCVVILEDDTPKGIFTERDIVRCIAEHGVHFPSFPITDVMTPDLVVAKANIPVHEACKLIIMHKIRHLVVVNGDGGILGMVTQSDMIEHLGYEYFIRVKTIDQVMNPEVITVSVRENLMEALRLMARLKVSFLVAMADGLPAGVITERDVARVFTGEQDLETVTVERIMSCPVITVPKDTAAFDAVKAMKSKSIRRLLVLDEKGLPAGVVTQSDMVKGLESKYIETLKTIITEQGRELEKAVQSLAEKTLYLDSILSSSLEMGIVATDRNWRIAYYNEAARDILGYSGREVLHRSVTDIHNVENVLPERLNAAISSVQGGYSHSFTFERRGAMGVRHIQARLSGIRNDGDISGLVLLLQDLTDMRQAQETIRKLAYHDMLTDLPNRVMFTERLAVELARAKRTRSQLALMIMDMDRFKEINDTMGHPAGDMLLKAVASRLRGSLRETDIVARMGGDEFAVIAPDVDGPETVLELGRKIASLLDPPFWIEDCELDMCFSIGAALYPDQATDGDMLYKLADRAMYEAKRLGHGNMRSNVILHATASGSPAV